MYNKTQDIRTPPIYLIYISLMISLSAISSACEDGVNDSDTRLGQSAMSAGSSLGDFSFIAGNQSSEEGGQDANTRDGDPDEEDMDIFEREDQDAEIDIEPPLLDMSADLEFDSEVPREPAPPRGQDEDGDGLEDYWEWSFNDLERFDWTNADSDGDGILDANEDEDRDGLTAYDEFFLATWLESNSEGLAIFTLSAPSPYQRDLFVELDQMEGYQLDMLSLSLTLESFAALSSFDETAEPPSGSNTHGVNLHIFIDQNLPQRTLLGDFESRFTLLRESAGLGEDYGDLRSELSVDPFIHVITASERSDDPNRAGEAINHPSDISSSGVILYLGTINAQHPSCGLDTPPPVPFIEVHEAQAGTLIHELGHTLQLGHDTELSGGINHYNVMSVIDGCVSARQRHHGEGNLDPLLGATTLDAASRFSAQATQLMRFDSKLSVDVSILDNEGRGYDH